MGAASFALLSQEDQEKKVSEMNDYIEGLQSQISQSAIGLCSELVQQ